MELFMFIEKIKVIAGVLSQQHRSHSAEPLKVKRTPFS
jgi:hypothetical protein